MNVGLLADTLGNTAMDETGRDYFSLNCFTQSLPIIPQSMLANTSKDGEEQGFKCSKSDGKLWPGANLQISVV